MSTLNATQGSLLGFLHDGPQTGWDLLETVGRRERIGPPVARAAFAAWIVQEPGPEQIRIPLLVTLWFGRHVPRDRRAEILEEQRVEHAARLAAYRRLTDSGEIADPDVRAVVEFGIAYEDAFLTWLRGLPREADR